MHQPVQSVVDPLTCGQIGPPAASFCGTNMREIDTRLGFSTFVGREADSLPGLLQSLKGHFDEYVVVCTNVLPDDGTWSYLRDLEKQWYPKVKAYRVAVPFTAGAFDFGQIRSTAAHLNTCGYVFMLDADERLDTKGLEALKKMHQLAREQEIDVVAFPRRLWHDGPFERKKENTAAYPDLQARLVRNDGDLRWRRPVHEQIRLGPDSIVPGLIGCPDVVIHHHHDWFRDNDTQVGKDKVYRDLAVSDPEWATSYTTDLLPADESRRRAIRKIYTTCLERDATPDEIQTWDGSGLSLEEIDKEVQVSEECNAIRRKTR